MPILSRLGLCALLLTTFGVSEDHQPVPANPPQLPAISQIRKSVAFIKMNCSLGNKSFEVSGTGFFVAYPDDRMGKGWVFIYLVTNRHMAECWSPMGQRMKVNNVSIKLNRSIPDANGILAQENYLTQHGNLNWIYPNDNSIDLAILPLMPSTSYFSFKAISVGLFATKKVLNEQTVTEGQPVLFTGFFTQFPGTKEIEPIVRQGIIAMMPDEELPLLGKPQKLYLADVHVFGGNSGSPVFINLGGMRNGVIRSGDDYRLLGVINGEIFEDEKFNLKLRTTITGDALANSGVATIVPADELKDLLDDPRLQEMRDRKVKESQNNSPNPSAN